MAGGKQTPRQKMINLMYLVFIAMLALNMSKEVLAAFGAMNNDFKESSERTKASNLAFLNGLETKAGENEEKYGPLLANAKEIDEASQSFYSYLEDLESKMLEGVKDPDDFQAMDKSDFLDTYFFEGDNLSENGKEFLAQIEGYRTKVLEVLPENMTEVRTAVSERFKTGEEDGKVRKTDGTRQPWLNYHYEGFPLIASLTKINQLQSKIRDTEEDALKIMLEGQLTTEVSMTNYTTLLEQDKGAYYSGEKFDGAIVLGRKDATTRPNEVNLTLDGRKLQEGRDFTIEDGKVKMNVNAGTPGDHKIEGNLVFMQDGEPVPVPVKSTFSTIRMPDAAVIAADKMNVVYRGVANPMTISVPGIADNKVNARATGLRRVNGSKYIMNPGSGRTVTIRASWTDPEGNSKFTNNEFRIKDIPRPSGTIRGEAGSVKMPKRNLEIATIGAMLEDFDFDLNIAVSEFKFKVPGQPTVVVKGNRMNAQAKSTIRRAKRGDNVQIFDIKAYITNNRNYKLKKVSPVVVELTN